jgi:hypothetical protein
MKLLDELSSAVISGDIKKTCKLAELLLNNGVCVDGVRRTMLKPIYVVDDKCTQKEYRDRCGGNDFGCEGRL